MMIIFAIIKLDGCARTVTPSPESEPPGSKLHNSHSTGFQWLLARDDIGHRHTTNSWHHEGRAAGAVDIGRSPAPRVVSLEGC